MRTNICTHHRANACSCQEECVAALHLTLEAHPAARARRPQPCCAETDRIVRRQPGLRLRRGHGGPRGVFLHAPSVQRDRRDRRRPRDERRPLVQLDQRRERRMGNRGVVVDGLTVPGHVAEDESMRGAPVEQPERHARVLRVRGATPALRPTAARPPLHAFEHEPLGRAGDEVGNDGVDGDPPARDAMPVCRSGRTREAMPGRRASASSSSETVIFPIAQSEPTVRTIRAGASRFAPVGTLRSSGGRAQVPELRTAAPRASSTSSGSSVDHADGGRSRGRGPARTQLFRSSRHSGGKRPPAVATPTSAVVGS